jgi:hypothetical protein
MRQAVTDRRLPELGVHGLLPLLPRRRVSISKI